MKTVNIQDAKTHLSRLVEAAAKVSRSSSGRPASRWSRSFPLMRRRRRGDWASCGALSRCPMISTRWTRRKSRSCSTATNEAPARHPHFALGLRGRNRLASALRIEDDAPDGRPGLLVRWLIGGDDGHAEFEPLADGFARRQIRLDAAQSCAIIFGCLRRGADLRGLP